MKPYLISLLVALAFAAFASAAPPAAAAGGNAPLKHSLYIDPSKPPIDIEVYIDGPPEVLKMISDKIKAKLEELHLI